MALSWFGVCGLILGMTVMCHGENFEKKLVSHLMSLYDDVDRITRPVEDNKEVVALQTGLNLVRVIDFNDDDDIVTIFGFNVLGWNDAELKWDPAKFGGLKDIRLPNDKIWTPDFTLYNGIVEENDKTEVDAVAIAMHDGTVIWVPKVEWSIPCVPEGRNTYNCTAMLGSWGMHIRLLDVGFYDGKAKIDLDFLEAHPEWQVTGSSAWRQVKEYECCPGDLYPSIHFSIILKKSCHSEGSDGTCGGN